MRKILILTLLLFSINGLAQDLKYTQNALNKLTAKNFWGRGYTKNGMAKAANFIQSEFKSFGLTPMDGIEFKQDFSYPVNTFPGKMELKIDNKKLKPGKEFIIQQASEGVKAKVSLNQKDSVNFINTENKIIITLQDKLTWSISQKVNDYTQIFIKKTAVKTIPNHLTINVENSFIPEFKASNICGLVRGRTNPDSVILITAHYDHLGGMGKKTYFPGANDNASGVSFLLSLAKYYAKNPQQYTIAFICFAGEEAGILGSKYFTENPEIPLQNIKFLFNVDMVGTGQDGATVVNATVYPKEFAMLNKVNDQSKLLVKINPRGKAANSDHYFFTEKGVPAFFLYTLGGISAYHDVYDKRETLPFTVYENLFKLFLGFNKELMK